MEIVLTWDLVLASAFVVLFVYNFMLGQDSTVKLILSVYIATLTADGVAKIFKEFLFDNSPGIQSLVGGGETEIFTIIRIVLFLLAIVFFVIRGAFHVGLEKHDHMVIRTTVHAIFAALSAILFLATILIYLSGNSFVEGMLFASQIAIYSESFIARILIDYYQFWFSLPAIMFLLSSFLFDEE